MFYTLKHGNKGFKSFCLLVTKKIQKQKNVITENSRFWASPVSWQWAVWGKFEVSEVYWNASFHIVFSILGGSEKEKVKKGVLEKNDQKQASFLSSSNCLLSFVSVFFLFFFWMGGFMCFRRLRVRWFLKSPTSPNGPNPSPCLVFLCFRFFKLRTPPHWP